MILILSEEDDISTNDVMDWLRYYKTEVFRINESSTITLEHLCLNNKEKSHSIKINNKRKVNLKDVSSYWYRRGYLNLKASTLNSDNEHKETFYYFSEYLSRENLGILLDIYLSLDEKPGIGSFFDNSTNKIYNLHIAKKTGLDIPDTTIITNKAQLKQFINKQKKIITKAITQGVSHVIDDKKIEGYTTVFDESLMNMVPDKFSPTLFQEQLDKNYELRIFYLNGMCYSMAIFSQLDPQTSVDFRNYNHARPNRTSPYKLPIKIKKRLEQFMKKLKMNSGSIDMVVTKDKKYVFLEVNPVGQFKQVSIPCNYYLEKKIAQYLSENGKRKYHKKISKGGKQ